MEELKLKNKLQKLREEREAKQKARIDKLREINLKKYAKDDLKRPSTTFGHRQSMKPVSDFIKPVSEFKKPAGDTKKPASDIKKPGNDLKKPANDLKKPANDLKKPANDLKKPANDIKKPVSTIKRPSTVPCSLKPPNVNNSITSKLHDIKNNQTILPKSNNLNKTDTTKIPVKYNSVTNIPPKNEFKKASNLTQSQINKNTVRQSLFLPNGNGSPRKFQPQLRKSMYETNSKKQPITTKKESVFERLYKPHVRTIQEKPVNNVTTRPKFEKSNNKSTRNIVLKHNNFTNMRRSISAVHFKRISKNELPRCIHKWSSVGEKLEQLHVKDTNEDESVRQERFVSAVKSDRKKTVKFHSTLNPNTPKAEELQSKLKTWLLKRGKSLDSYHHLQCFGIHHSEIQRQFMKPYEEENKENVEQSDGDDNSYTENLNDRSEDFANKWRRVSSMNSFDMNTTNGSVEDVSTPKVHRLEDLLIGALNDLTELLREGFEWQQCARWLRAIRERFPGAENVAAYWECRAALEERHGDLAATVQCWEEAIAKGTESSVVEASLDQLMAKFMQLEISPGGAGDARKKPNPRLVDVKNIFVSRVIRLAVQQAKLKQSDSTKYTMTPVRRSTRHSVSATGDKLPTPGDRLRTPGSSRRPPLVQLCSSLKQIDEEVRNNCKFVTNKNLDFSP